MVKQYAGTIKIESDGEGKGAKVTIQVRMKLEKFATDPDDSPLMT